MNFILKLSWNIINIHDIVFCCFYKQPSKGGTDKRKFNLLIMIQNNHHWRKQRFQFIGNCLKRLGCIQLVYYTSSLELFKVSDDILSRLFILFTLTFKFLCLFFSNIVNFVFPAESFLYGLVRCS